MPTGLGSLRASPWLPAGPSQRQGLPGVRRRRARPAAFARAEPGCTLAFGARLRTTPIPAWHGHGTLDAAPGRLVLAGGESASYHPRRPDALQRAVGTAGAAVGASGPAAYISAATAVIAARFTMSATVVPCWSTVTGFFMPIRTGPMASARPSR